MHIVHKNAAGKYGVLGFFFDKTAGADKNLFLDSVINAYGADAENPADLSKLLTPALDLENYWTYDGSLTTTPCTEGVVWTVLK